MTRLSRTLALATAAVACSDSIAPKPPSATSLFVKMTAAVSKSTLGPGDTATFSYSVKNITADSLTLTTQTGCQILPELDQVDGPRMSPPPLKEILCPPDPTVRRLAAGKTETYGLLIRGYDSSKPVSQQTPGYLLTKGTFDASVLLTANEVGTPVRSDWVRFTVK